MSCRIWMLTLLCCLLGYSLTAQTSFFAETEAKTVLSSSYIQVRFTLVNGQGSRFQPPDFKDFSVRGGPNDQISMQTINGKTTTTISYVYVLQPKRTGMLTIGSASIRVNGKVLKSDPITIKVVQGKEDLDQPTDQSNAYFFKAEPSKTTCYIGEEITIDLKIYLDASLNKVRHRLMLEPDYPGAYAEPVNWYRAFQEVVDGKQYRSWIIRRVVLYPQQTGKITIGSAQINIDYSTGQPSFGFFGTSTERVILNSDPLEIEVLPVPDQRPADFLGLVGRFEINSNLNRQALTTDDALTLRMVISGMGDIKRLQLPDLGLSPDTFEVYPPKMLREYQMEKQGSIEHLREIEYLILPKVPGEYPLQMEFSYFDVNSNDFAKLRTEATLLNVRPGNKRPNSNRPPSQKTEAPPITLEPIQATTRLEKANHYFVGSPAFWVLTALPILLFLGSIGLKRYRSVQAGVDPALVAQRKARKRAQQHLAAAKQFLLAQQPSEFYNEVSKATLGYVSDKLKLERSKLTKHNVREKLEALQVKPGNIETFMHILKTCEMALFAGQARQEGMEKIYSETEEVITQIEADLNKG